MTLGAVARGLQPIAFGTFVLITGYSAFVLRIFGFQSWQPLITFGSQPDHTDKDSRSSLFSAGLSLDALAAAAAVVIGIAGAPIAARVLNLDVSSTALLLIANVVNITALAGMPTAVLRIYDRHALYSAHSVLSAVARLLLVGTTALATSDLASSIWAWAVAQLVTNLSLLTLGAWVARSEGVLTVFAPLRAIQTIPGLAKSFWQTNLIQTAKVFREGDVLLVGALVGHEASGIFKIARQLGDVMIKAADPLLIALFPEFARLSGGSDARRFAQLFWASTAIVAFGATFGVVVFAIAGHLIIRTLFGASFLTAQPLLLLCVAAAAVRVSGQSPLAALLAAKRSGNVLLGMTITGILYYTLLVVAATAGYVAIGSVIIVANALTTGWMLYGCVRLFHSRASAA